jgi:hypothetical protein
MSRKPFDPRRLVLSLLVAGFALCGSLLVPVAVFAAVVGYFANAYGRPAVAALRERRRSGGEPPALDG